MTRVFLALLLFAGLVPAQAGELWSQLWRNADQRGEALLQQGDASSAAKVYADPRRKAYAKLQAGDYQGAAQDLEEVHDSEADYNRGNALAHAGNLQGALDAYDAALKSDPNNRDAQHNRELVASALKQQPQKSADNQSGDNKSGDEKKDGQQDKGQDASENKKQGGQDRQQDNAKPGDKSGQGQSGNPEKSAKADHRSEKGQDATGQDGQGKQGRQGQNAADGQGQNGKDQAGKDQTGNNRDERADGKPGRQDAARNDAGQARRDAEASLALSSADGKPGAGDSDPAKAGRATGSTVPKSEQQLAQEQWLRSIPEDPGGLLRRKFMIEHMMRQKKAQP